MFETIEYKEAFNVYQQKENEVLITKFPFEITLGMDSEDEYSYRLGFLVEKIDEDEYDTSLFVVKNMDEESMLNRVENNEIITIISTNDTTSYEGALEWIDDMDKHIPAYIDSMFMHVEDKLIFLR